MKKLHHLPATFAAAAVGVFAAVGVAIGDTVAPDADFVTTGDQGSKNLGSVQPGTTVSPQVSFRLVCDGNKHVDNGQTVTLSQKTVSAPAGGSISASTATIGSVSDSWPDDTTGSSNCGTTTPLPDNGDSTVTITAPKKADTYSYSVSYNAVLSPAGTNDSASLTAGVSAGFSLTVPNVAPKIDSFTGDTSATIGDAKTYDVTASDANDDALTYKLEAVAGSAGTTITGDTSTSPQVTFNEAGTVTLKETVSDGTSSTSLTKTVTVSPLNSAPGAPGKPGLSDGSSSPNKGVFGLDWTASTDDGKPDGSALSYRLEHKDANDAAYSLVTGADSLAGNSYTFGSGGNAAEGEGTWTYQVKGSDGSLASEFSAASDAVKVDKSGPNAPSIAPSKSPEYDPSGTDDDWFKNSVALSFSANGDPELQDDSTGSGVDASTVPSDVTKSTSGSHTVSGTVKDNVGNESASASRTVKVDATDPSVTVTGCPSAVVAKNSSHTVDVVASDSHSGLATDPTATGVALDTSSTGSQTASFKAVDNVGHERTASCAYTVNTAPGAPGTPGLATGSSTPNTGSFALSWTGAVDIDNNLDHYVLEHKDADDAAYSEVAGNVITNLFSFAASPETEGTWKYRAKAVDSLGEESSYSSASTEVKVDKSKPNAPTLSVSSGQSPTTVDGVDWYKDSVSVDVTSNGDRALADGSAGSGVNAASFSSPFTVTTNGPSTPGRTVKDNVGIESDAGSTTVNVDAKDPSVSISGCPTEVNVGSSQSITVGASDDESGLAASLPATVSLDTSSVGEKTKTVTATDKVGHSTSKECKYKVIYSWNGFFQPIDNGGVYNRAKAGSAVPVKFSLDGAPVPGSMTTGMGTESSLLASGSPASGPMSCPTSAAYDAVEELATDSTSGLKYDMSADQWVYVWKTSSGWAGSCRQLILKLADGGVYRANFQFTK